MEDTSWKSLLGSWRYISKRNGQTKTYQIRECTPADEEHLAAQAQPAVPVPLREEAGSPTLRDDEGPENFSDPNEQYLVYQTGGFRVKLRRAATPPTASSLQKQFDSIQPPEETAAAPTPFNENGCSPFGSFADSITALTTACTTGEVESEWYGFISDSQRLRVIKKRSGGNDVVVTVFEGQICPMYQTAVSVGLFDELIGIWSYKSNSTGALHAYCILPTQGQLEWSESGISGTVEYVPFLSGAPRGYSFRVCLKPSASSDVAEECLWIKAATAYTEADGDGEAELVTLYQQKANDGSMTQAIEVASRLKGPQILVEESEGGETTAGITSPLASMGSCMYEVAETKRIAHLKSLYAAGGGTGAGAGERCVSKSPKGRGAARKVGSLPAQADEAKTYQTQTARESNEARRERLGISIEKKKEVSRRALARLTEDDRRGTRASVSPNRHTRVRSASPPTKERSQSSTRFAESETFTSSVLLRRGVDPPDSSHISSVTFGKPQQRQVGSSPARNSNSHDSFNKPTSALNKRDERSNEVQAKKSATYYHDLREFAVAAGEASVYTRSDEVEVEVIDPVASSEPYTADTIVTMWVPGVVKRVKVDGTGAYDVRLSTTGELLEGVKTQDLRRANQPKKKTKVIRSASPQAVRSASPAAVSRRKVHPHPTDKSPHIPDTLASRSRTSYNRTRSLSNHSRVPPKVDKDKILAHKARFNSPSANSKTFSTAQPHRGAPVRHFAPPPPKAV